jgi:hypothetical protein
MASLPLVKRECHFVNPRIQKNLDYLGPRWSLNYDSDCLRFGFENAHLMSHFHQTTLTALADPECWMARNMFPTFIGWVPFFIDIGAVQMD